MLSLSKERCEGQSMTINKKIRNSVFALAVLTGIIATNVYANNTSDQKIKDALSSETNFEDKTIKLALAEFPTYEDFTNEFLKFNDKTWIVASFDKNKNVSWASYSSEKDIPENEKLRATVARVKEKLLLRDTQKQISLDHEEGYEKLSYSSSNHKIFGENQDITVNAWSLEKNKEGQSGVKIDFTLENKSNKKIDLEEFAKSRFVVHQMINNKLDIDVDFISDNLKGNIVHPHKKMSGTIFVNVLPDEQLQSFTFGISRVEGDKQVGGLTLNL